jgi:hypothetical protein
MKHKIAAIVLGWAFLGIAPSGTEYVFNFGSLANCRDHLGSAVNDHRFACHLHPNGPNCESLGPSEPVQAGWSFSNDCVETKPFKFIFNGIVEDKD